MQAGPSRRSILSAPGTGAQRRSLTVVSIRASVARQGLANVALSRRQRGAAKGGLSPLSLYAPVSQGLTDVALSRRQKEVRRGWSLTAASTRANAGRA
eukprot:1741313-Pyramimonas_sp.AAC.1